MSRIDELDLLRRIASLERRVACLEKIEGIGEPMTFPARWEPMPLKCCGESSCAHYWACSKTGRAPQEPVKKP